MPPRYIPLGQSEVEVEVVKDKDEHPASHPVGEWSSGICACFDDMQSCKLLFVLDLALFGRLLVKGAFEYCEISSLTSMLCLIKYISKGFFSDNSSNS